MTTPLGALDLDIHADLRRAFLKRWPFGGRATADAPTLGTFARAREPRLKQQHCIAPRRWLRMGIDSESRSGRRVTKDARDRCDVHALRQQQRRCRMPDVMQPRGRNSGPFSKGLPAVVAHHCSMTLAPANRYEYARVERGEKRRLISKHFATRTSRKRQSARRARKGNYDRRYWHQEGGGE